MRRLLLAFACVMFIGLAAGGLWWSFALNRQDEVCTAIVLLIFALAFLGLGAPLVAIMLGRMTWRANVAEGATTIRPSRIVDGLSTWSTVLLIVGVANFAVWYPQGKLDLPMPQHDATIVILAIGLALVGVPNLWSIFTQRGSSFIRLSPEGFALYQGVRTVRGEWADLTAITDRRRGNPAPIRAILVLELASGGQRAHVSDLYTPKPAAIRQFVRFYWINPERRDELTDGRAVDRLAALVAET